VLLPLTISARFSSALFFLGIVFLQLPFFRIDRERNRANTANIATSLPNAKF
jgi:hypothetical protein